MPFYNRKGEKISIPEADRLLQDRSYVHVAITAVGDLTVSTVWLGVDYDFTREGPPILFETMVFGPKGFEEAGQQYRWPTEEAALAGHDQVVAAMRESVAESQ